MLLIIAFHLCRRIRAAIGFELRVLRDLAHHATFRRTLWVHEQLPWVNGIRLLWIRCLAARR
jgi:hypothetical protein